MANNTDIVDRFVEYRCKKCGFEDDIEYDMVEEMDMFGSLTLDCPHCGKRTLVPKKNK